MKFAEGLVSSLCSCLHLRPRRTLTSWSLCPSPLQTPTRQPRASLASSGNHQLPRHYGIADLPDLLQVIFAQNRFNSNLGIRLFLLYVSRYPLTYNVYTRARVRSPLPTFSHMHVRRRFEPVSMSCLCQHVSVCANADKYGLSTGCVVVSTSPASNSV